MILGQLRTGARSTTYAALQVSINKYHLKTICHSSSGLGDPSQHNINYRIRGLGDPSQHRFDNIDIKKVIDVWPGESSRQI